MPTSPVARRTSSDEANACRAVASDLPLKPNRDVIVVKIELRVLDGASAGTTMTTGKNETNAFAANATLRSTNSISSKRSQTRHTIVRSADARTASTRPRQGLSLLRAVRTRPDPDIASTPVHRESPA